MSKDLQQKIRTKNFIIPKASKQTVSSFDSFEKRIYVQSVRYTNIRIFLVYLKTSKCSGQWLALRSTASCVRCGWLLAAGGSAQCSCAHTRMDDAWNVVTSVRGRSPYLSVYARDGKRVEAYYDKSNNTFVSCKANFSIRYIVGVTSHSATLNDPHWQRLWRCEVPPKVKVFRGEYPMTLYHLEQIFIVDILSK